MYDKEGFEVDYINMKKTAEDIEKSTGLRVVTVKLSSRALPELMTLTSGRGKTTLVLDLAAKIVAKAVADKRIPEDVKMIIVGGSDGGLADVTDEDYLDRMKSRERWGVSVMDSARMCLAAAAAAAPSIHFYSGCPTDSPDDPPAVVHPPLWEVVIPKFVPRMRRRNVPIHQYPTKGTRARYVACVRVCVND